MALKFAYLHKVDGDANNNKFYIMRENADGTFTATYGREGAAKPATEIYPMAKWDKKLNEKLSSKKGYTDVTEQRAVVATPAKTKTGNILSNDPDVADFVKMLQQYAKIITAEVYLAEAKGVTQSQIDRAQSHIDTLSRMLQELSTSKSFNINDFNRELTGLYTIIPRKMKNVKDNLIDITLAGDKLSNKIQELLGNEQSNLYAMAGQVVQNATDDSDDSTSSSTKTELEILGLHLKRVTDSATIKMVKDKAENHGHRVKRVYEVVNKSTQTAYDAHLKKSANKKKDLLWHGSRRQNWWFIIQQGLRIRPAGAVHTGSMFGDGIYFASESDKSMGYTDGGRWTGTGRGGEVYMALYEVHLGEQYKTQNSDSSLSAAKLKRLGSYDSTWGQKGPNLYRHEYIIYNSDQCTIKFIVEFS